VQGKRLQEHARLAVVDHDRSACRRDRGRRQCGEAPGGGSHARAPLRPDRVERAPEHLLEPTCQPLHPPRVEVGAARLGRLDRETGRLEPPQHGLPGLLHSGRILLDELQLRTGGERLRESHARPHARALGGAGARAEEGLLSRRRRERHRRVPELRPPQERNSESEGGNREKGDHENVCSTRTHVLLSSPRRISAAGRDAIIASPTEERELATNSTRQTTWIVLTVALGAAVVGLAIWAVVLQRDQDDANAASAARIELEQQNAELEAQVSDLGEQVTALQQDLDDAQASAESSAAEAQNALEAAQDQLEAATDELGAKGDQLAESEAELKRLAAEAEAAVAEAESATASAQDRADAEAARADLAEACLGAVADVLRRLYASDDVAEALERAAEELEAIAADCEQA
jgi:hypothetical protein